MLGVSLSLVKIKYSVCVCEKKKKRNILPVDNGTGHSCFQETKDAPQELPAGMGGWSEQWVTRVKSLRTLAGGGHTEVFHFLIWVVVIGVSTYVCWGPQDHPRFGDSLGGLMVPIYHSTGHKAKPAKGKGMWGEEATGNQGQASKIPPSGVNTGCT